MPGTFIANQRPVDRSTLNLKPAKTYISFDKGGNWSLIPVPESLKSECPVRIIKLFLYTNNSRFI